MGKVIEFPKGAKTLPKGRPTFRDPEADDFVDRMQKIKVSLERISQLLTEMKIRSES